MTKSWIDKLIPKVAIPEGRSGPWQIKRVNIEDNVMLRIRERYFEPGIYTQLVHDKRGLVMSDTPAERFDHAEFVRAANGDVLISGLGIGMCIGAVLKNPDVQSVTVLEIDPHVIKLVGPSYKDKRLTIVQADARKWSPPKGKRFGRSGTIFGMGFAPTIFLKCILSIVATDAAPIGGAAGHKTKSGHD